MNEEHFQILPWDVNSFPKTVGSKENAMIGRTLKLLDHLMFSSGHPLGKKLYPLFFENRIQLEIRLLNARERCKKTESPSSHGKNRPRNEGINPSAVEFVLHVT